MKPELLQLGTAAASLSSYISDYGDEANVTVLAAQIGLIQKRFETFKLANLETVAKG